MGLFTSQWIWRLMDKVFKGMATSLIIVLISYITLYGANSKVKLVLDYLCFDLRLPYDTHSNILFVFRNATF